MYLLLHDMIYINCMHDMISIYIACIICYYAITQYMSFFLIRVPEKNCYTKIKKTTFLKNVQFRVDTVELVCSHDVFYIISL